MMSAAAAAAAAAKLVRRMICRQQLDGPSAMPPTVHLSLSFRRRN